MPPSTQQVVVTDSSLVIKWLVREHDSPRANELLGGWLKSGISPLIPSWGLAEICNSFLQRLSRGEGALLAVLDDLSELPRFVTTIEMTYSLCKRALAMAQQAASRSVYDFFFLALAEDLGCELWTADERFFRMVEHEYSFVRWLGNVREVAEPETQ